MADYPIDLDSCPSDDELFPQISQPTYSSNCRNISDDASHGIHLRRGLGEQTFIVGWVNNPSSGRIDRSAHAEGATEARMLKELSNNRNNIITSEWNRTAHRFGRHINCMEY
jgi:hypothetical protein